MNNIKILTVILFNVCLISCSEPGKLYTTSAKIYLINETNVVVKSDSISGYIIKPGDTIICTESNRSEWSDKPTVDNYFPFSDTKGSRVFIYGDNSQCELGLSRIENYENRKEVSPLNFEFTFRFTTEKQNKAKPCNL